MFVGLDTTTIDRIISYFLWRYVLPFCTVIFVFIVYYSECYMTFQFSFSSFYIFLYFELPIMLFDTNKKFGLKKKSYYAALCSLSYHILMMHSQIMGKYVLYSNFL